MDQFIEEFWRMATAVLPLAIIIDVLALIGYLTGGKDGK